MIRKRVKKMRTKPGLTLSLELYSTEVQRTFMLTFVLFMVVMKSPFPQLADGLGNNVQAWSLLKMQLNLVNLILQVALGLLKKSNIAKSDARYTS